MEFEIIKAALQDRLVHWETTYEYYAKGRLVYKKNSGESILAAQTEDWGDSIYIVNGGHTAVLNRELIEQLITKGIGKKEIPYGHYTITFEDFQV